MTIVNIFLGCIGSILVGVGFVFLNRRRDKTVTSKKTSGIKSVIEAENTTITGKERSIMLILYGAFTFLFYGWIGTIFGKNTGYISAAFLTFVASCALIYNAPGLYGIIEFDGEKSWLRRIKLELIRFRTVVIYGVIMPVILLGSWLFLDQKLANRLQALEKITQATIAANNLKHKSELRTLNVKHKKDIARERSKNRRKVAKVKMKERSKRWFASIPIIGTALVLWSGKDEYDDYEVWKAENPTGTAENYAKYKAELLIGD